jgi:hypothetical protein
MNPLALVISILAGVVITAAMIYKTMVGRAIIAKVQRRFR